MNKLIIVESPTKASTLSRFLGSGYSVDSTKGHIKDLPKSKLGIDVDDNFKPEYLELEKKKDVIKKLQDQSVRANQIFIATDPDREGEAIANHVQEILTDGKLKNNLKKIQRITFHEITKTAVDEAIASPGSVNKNLVDAQIARRVLDRLVGYKLSPLLWKKVRRGLSAGRVQSVAVRLIVEKEKEIEKFKSQEYWEIGVNLSKIDKTKSEFWVNLINEKVENQKQADEICIDLKKSKYTCLSVNKKEVNKRAYPPFTTSTMTQAGARLFGWSAKKTMGVAQKLYEQGLITYHRTDSMNISIQAVNVVRDFISKKYGKEYLPEKPIFYKTSSKSAQEAHEAIRPTSLDDKNVDAKMDSAEKKLFDLIRRRFIACQMQSSKYSETQIDVLAENKAKHKLRASGQIMIFDGWRKMFPLDSESVILPEVVKGEELKYLNLNSQQKFTQPPARFNEASLIKTLEKLGIGRPSTYAPIISTIQVRGYVEKQEGKFFPTTIGKAVVEFLTNHFPDELDYGFTASMEENLDKIALGKAVWFKTIGSFFKPFEKKIKKVEKDAKRVKIETEKVGRICPTCKKGDLVIRVGRFGKFISCSTFPDCRHIEKYIEKTGFKCEACKDGELIVKRSSKGKKFFGCSNYPKCKNATWKLPKKEDK